MSSISDADEQYLAEIAVDCAERLGPGAELLSLSRESDAPVVQLRLRYRLGEQEHETSVSGASLFDAHRALRDVIVVDRLRFGFTDLLART